MTGPLVLTDTHCHLDFDSFAHDREDVLQRAEAAGVERILIPGITLASSRAALRLAEGNPRLFAAVGVHPTEAQGVSDGTWQELRRLAGNARVRAIGEIGLDDYWQTVPQPIQKQVLADQLEMAAELGLPVVLHCREKGGASGGGCMHALLHLLESWLQKRRQAGWLPARPVGVLHSFSGSLEAAWQAIGLGFLIGVGGAVTYSKVRQAVTAQIGLENLLLETDAPFLSPLPGRGSRNEPANVRLIADKIAVLHGCTPGEVSAVTSVNASRIFQWDK